RVGENSIEADGGEQKREDSERGGEVGYEPLLRELVFNAEFERFDVEHRESFVERVELVAHGCDHRRRVWRRGAYVERWHVRGKFLEGDPCCGARGFVAVIIVSIRNDTDDLA